MRVVYRFAETRYEWMVLAQAAFAHNITVATVYASLGADALVYTFGQTEVTHVITEANLVGTVLKVCVCLFRPCLAFHQVE